MALPRKHIPLSVRCEVALRQLRKTDERLIDEICSADSFGPLLKILLVKLAKRLECSVADLRLDHDPALVNREKIIREGKIVSYIPDELDPACLIYRSKDDHHRKTNIIGDHGQYSDTTLAKRERRRTYASDPRPKVRYPKRKTEWPKRKLQGRSIWRRR